MPGRRWLRRCCCVPEPPVATAPQLPSGNIRPLRHRCCTAAAAVRLSSAYSLHSAVPLPAGVAGTAQAEAASQRRRWRCIQRRIPASGTIVDHCSTAIRHRSEPFKIYFVESGPQNSQTTWFLIIVNAELDNVYGQ